MNNPINTPSLDVIIPCYNAADTLDRTVVSVLNQSACQRIILVNDGSTDDTAARIDALAKQYDNIIAHHLPANSGVAFARNFGALCSSAELIAFIDADDAYENGALDVVPSIFALMPNLSLLRLKLRAIDLPARYADHPDLGKAWDILQMTVGGNMIFRRALFLGCGGFPTDTLFRSLGGEDGALGIALAEMSAVGTLFDDEHRGVLHYCRDGMHAERLLDAYLFGKHDPRITPDAAAYARATTDRIKARLDSLKPILNETAIGRRPLILTYAD
ncbi:glycosyltransferase family 2 protein [Moraxella sp. FZFQ2102]|uniref:glycosyltransferase n=1 Tax=Moraxella sp. FZFQ2102 TaxID=2953752 RepID=UPI00209C09DB|nr:glycosyltransferase family A protein [Moraxella sp. FZFQ2102]USZ13887.1 glycosyltransferase family 2 protein [Moraxella sp. FZFQ2102]